MSSIPVTWNENKKDYELNENTKAQLKQLPKNTAVSIKRQLMEATKCTRSGLMDPVERIEF